MNEDLQTAQGSLEGRAALTQNFMALYQASCMNCSES